MRKFPVGPTLLVCIIVEIVVAFGVLTLAQALLGIAGLVIVFIAIMLCAAVLDGAFQAQYEKIRSVQGIWCRSNKMTSWCVAAKFQAAAALLAIGFIAHDLFGVVIGVLFAAYAYTKHMKELPRQWLTPLWEPPNDS